MKRIIFFDLDGTLINPQKRYYTIYTEICKQVDIEPFSSDIYWNLKRNKTSEYEIFSKSKLKNFELQKILDKRVEMLENRDYLIKDTLYDGIVETLDILREKFLLVVVTFRQNRVELEAQLERLGIVEYFDKILSRKPVNNPKFMGKVNLIKENYKNFANAIYFGDTEVDMLAAQYLDCLPIACVNGIRTKKILRSKNEYLYISSWDMKSWDKLIIKELSL